MARSIQKACDDYDKRFGGTNEGSFFLSDIEQIRDMVLKDAYNGMSVNALLYKTISISLTAGFMIGYRKGRTDGKKR